MTTKANYFKTGVFVIAAVALIVGGIIAFGAGLFTKDTLLLETYIDESVQGLSVGSPVLFRGVQIGTVRQITFLPRGYPDKIKYGSEAYQKYNRYVLVIMGVDRSNFPPNADNDKIRRIVTGWVEGGLRLRIVLQALTGVSYIEADYVDPARHREKIIEPEWEPLNIYVPAAPSLFRNLSTSIESILASLNKIDYQGIAASLSTTLATIEKTVADAGVKEVRTEMVALMTDLRETNRLVVEMLDQSKNPEGVNIPGTIAQLDKTLRRMENFVTVQQSEFEDTLTNVRRTAENLREVSDTLRRYPGAIIGGPPSRSEMPR